MRQNKIKKYPEHAMKGYSCFAFLNMFLRLPINCPLSHHLSVALSLYKADIGFQNSSSIDFAL